MTDVKTLSESLSVSENRGPKHHKYNTPYTQAGECFNARGEFVMTLEEFNSLPEEGEVVSEPVVASPEEGESTSTPVVASPAAVKKKKVKAKKRVVTDEGIA